MAIVLDDEHLVAYSASDPIYTCRRDDRDGMRLAAGMLSHLQLGGVQSLATALGVSRELVRRNRKLFAEGGVEAIRSRKTGPKGPHKLTASLRVRAQRGLDQGASIRGAAKEVGVSEGTLRHAIRTGHLRRPLAAKEPASPSEELSSPSDRAREDQGCEWGVGTRRVIDRLLACTGNLPEALPEFQAAAAVPGAGVLLALPALLEQGLIEVGQQVFGALRNGFFGLQSVLMTLAFMALLRIKTPEQLTGHAPGELGLLLGLDRAPEVKTIRRKLAELGARSQARHFHQRLAERWAEANPEQLGLLYLDGHVRPYHGRTHKLPKHHVPQRGRPMPGTQDFYVNDARAEPLFVVTAETTESLLAMMEDHLLPEIRFLVGLERRVTVVFDREGWSPECFARWKELSFDVLTYRKGEQSRWQERFFDEVAGTVEGRQVTYQLAERRVQLKNGLSVREVRRLAEDGHQTSVITTNERFTPFEVAQHMFRRWRQENFFRYMRQEFALDHLCTYHVEPADPKRLVPHPQRQKLDRQIRAAKAAVGELVGRRGDLEPGATLRVKGRTLDEDGIDQLLRQREDDIQRLKKRRDALPKQVPLDEVFEAEQIVELERERKLLTDAVKMIAYRAESQLARWVAPLFKRHEDEARKFLQSVFRATADLIPDTQGGTLTVRFHGLANPRATRALAGLCEVVNATPTCYPGTELRLNFEAPECHIN
ncbi:putative transposase [Candidatus Latescibacterota bacterium]